MNTTIDNPSFTRTGNIWFWLIIACILWLEVCAWALKSYGFTAGSLFEFAKPVQPAIMEMVSDGAVSGDKAVAEPLANVKPRPETEESGVLSAEKMQSVLLPADTQTAHPIAHVPQRAEPVAAETAQQPAAELAAPVQEAQNHDAPASDNIETADTAEEEQHAVAASRKLAYERERAEELLVLSGLSLRIRFLPGSAEITGQVERSLDRMFGPLYLYSEVPVMVAVATNEGSDSVSDSELSRERGQAIVAYLAGRGLDQDRFQIRIDAGDALPVGTHRVQVLSRETDQ